LSNFVPRPILGLLQRAAVDGRVGADLHVVLDQQRPLLRKLRVSAGLLVAHIAEAVRAQHHSGMNDDAIAAAWFPDRARRADRCGSRSPMRTPSPITAPASMRVPAPMLRILSNHRAGPMLTPSPSFTFAPTTAAGCTPVAGSAGLSSLAARANHSRGCSASTTHFPCG
jgi:hypothetical protein